MQVHVYLSGFYPLGEGGGGGGGGGRGKASPPQNLVTDCGTQEIFGVNCVKRDLKTPQNPRGNTPPDPLHNVYLCSRLL